MENKSLSAEELINFIQDAQDTIERKFPPLEHGEDEDLSVIWDALEQSKVFASQKKEKEDVEKLAEESKMFCEIEVWLHSHFETKDFLQIELFGITKIYSGRLDDGYFDLIQRDLGENQDDFKNLPLETAYKADVMLDYEDNEPYFTFYNIKILDNAGTK